MQEHNDKRMIQPHEFLLPFEGRLNHDNCWVHMASHMPWNEVEEAYIKMLGDTKQESKAYNFRLALGCLFFKKQLLFMHLP